MINRSQLKWIAVISMIADHVGMVFFPELVWMRLIGRLAFPIYAYCIAEGFTHTGDFRKYFLRLSVMALLSEVPYDLLCFGRIVEPDRQNIFFTLAAGLFLLRIWEKYHYRAIVCVAASAGFLALAEFFCMDYGAGGILMILAFFLIRGQRFKTMGWTVFAAVNLLCYGSWVQWAALAAAVPLYLYDGVPVKKKQRFFYWIYPLHLLVLWIVAEYTGIR